MNFTRHLTPSSKIITLQSLINLNSFLALCQPIGAILFPQHLGSGLFVTPFFLECKSFSLDRILVVNSSVQSEVQWWLKNMSKNSPLFKRQKRLSCPQSWPVLNNSLLLLKKYLFGRLSSWLHPEVSSLGPWLKDRDSLQSWHMGSIVCSAGVQVLLGMWDLRSLTTD